MTFRILTALALLGLMQNVHAESWISFGFVSKHTRGNLNGNNAGVGIEKPIAEDWAIVAGNYQNSLDEASSYAGAFWMPLHYSDRLSAGVVLGAVTGYSKRADVSPMVLPTFAVAGGPVGINLVLIPPMGGVRAPAAALQFKVRL